MSNIRWQEGKVDLARRRSRSGHHNKVIWLTGLSGSGKSTIAHQLELTLHEQGKHTYVLDGDNVRHGLNGDLKFSPEERKENIRRISEVAKLFHDAGVYVIISFISPYREDREKARSIIGEDFIEVFVDCAIEECEKRDVKGLYAKARAGEIQDFTGVQSPYEAPEQPEVTVKTHEEDVDACVACGCGVF